MALWFSFVAVTQIINSMIGNSGGRIPAEVGSLAVRGTGAGHGLLAGVPRSGSGRRCCSGRAARGKSVWRPGMRLNHVGGLNMLLDLCTRRLVILAL